MQNGREGGEFKKLKWILQPKKSNYPAKRWGHTCMVHKGKILLFGGNHSTQTHQGIHRLDCESLENTLLDYAEQPQVRESHASVLFQDCLYAHGGCIGQEVLFFNSTHELTSELLQLELSGANPNWRRIEQKNSIIPRESHVAVLIQDQYMLIYGGTTQEEEFLDEFWLFDFKSNTWLTICKIDGKIDASIGITMTPIGEFIYSFGGEWGEGEDSQYSNDLCQLRFQQEIRGTDVPPLIISKVETSGVKPNPRTGHAAVNYKGKMLLILGGEGVSSKRASILYNDLWSFDLRNNTWSELAIQNRTVFRPRTNFTANIYKNTIYIFGGFVTLGTFKSTDELMTITLTETRQALRQEYDYRSSVAAQNNNPPVYCNQCRFQFVKQERPPVKEVQFVRNELFLQSSTQNILYSAKFIDSPLEALGLITDSISRVNPKIIKTLTIHLNIQGSQNLDPLLGQLLEKSHLSFSIDGLNLNKRQLQQLSLSYRCDIQDPGFDLKNGLLRLGKEALIGQLYDDGIYHGHFINNQGIIYITFPLNNLSEELEKLENVSLTHFLDQNGVNLGELIPYQLKIYVGSLSRIQTNLELKLEHGKLFTSENRSFEVFMNDYFLSEKAIFLIVNDNPIPLTPFEKIIRAEGTEREQEPTTSYFSKVHLITQKCNNGSIDGNQAESPQQIRLYALGRKVGIYSKYATIYGFIELSDPSSLNFPRTRCESHQIRLALQQEVRVLLQQSRKRPNGMGVKELQMQAEQPM